MTRVSPTAAELASPWVTGMGALPPHDPHSHFHSTVVLDLRGVVRRLQVRELCGGGWSPIDPFVFLLQVERDLMSSPPAIPTGQQRHAPDVQVVLSTNESMGLPGSSPPSKQRVTTGTCVCFGTASWEAEAPLPALILPMVRRPSRRPSKIVYHPRLWLEERSIVAVWLSCL